MAYGGYESILSMIVAVIGLAFATVGFPYLNSLAFIYEKEGYKINYGLGIGVGAACPVLISAIGANKNGKRTALVYLINDLFGLILWSVIFYTVNAIVHFGFMDMIMSPVSQYSLVDSATADHKVQSKKSVSYSPLTFL